MQIEINITYSIHQNMNSTQILHTYIHDQINSVKNLQLQLKTAGNLQIRETWKSPE
jgi:hypothetical protein